MALSLQYDEAKIVGDYFNKHPRMPSSSAVMIDVGAHFGTSFRSYLALGWRIVAFEPDSTKLPKLQQYLSNPNLTFYKAAVGDRVTGNIQFYTSAESTGIASLVPFRESHEPSETVEMTTLSIEMAKLKIDKVDYLKIDTEGYDLHVLKGHDWNIKPEVIMTEFDEIKTRPQNFSFNEIGDLLIAQGYEAWCSEWAPLVKYGSGHAWSCIKKYPCELNHPDGWGNFIAIRPDAQVETIKQLIQPHL